MKGCQTGPNAKMLPKSDHTMNDGLATSQWKSPKGEKPASNTEGETNEIRNTVATILKL
jgi:hypothetical protein